MHAVILQCLLSCACLCSNSKWCLPLSDYTRIDADRRL